MSCRNHTKDNYKVPILRDLFTGVKRFNELRRRLTDVIQKILTQQLIEIENDEIYPIANPKVEYYLAELDKTIKPVIASIVH